MKTIISDVPMLNSPDYKFQPETEDHILDSLDSFNEIESNIIKSRGVYKDGWVYYHALVDNIFAHIRKYLFTDERWKALFHA